MHNIHGTGHGYILFVFNSNKLLRLLLYIFEMMSGLKVNFQKSEILTVGGDEMIDKTYAELFNCDIGHFPLKYLGMPVSFTTLKNSDWEFLVGKYLKRFDAWVGNAASLGGRHTLLNSVVTQISLYHMSMWLMNKTFVEKLDKHTRRFFWQGCNKKYTIIWSNGVGFVDPETKGASELRISANRTLVLW